MVKVGMDRYEPGCWGGVLSGICGKGESCWAKLVVETSKASVRPEIVRAIIISLRKAFARRRSDGAVRRMGRQRSEVLMDA
jgi:hypothetical protein